MTDFIPYNQSPQPDIDEIAARHVRCVCCVTRPPDCGSCGHLWPCDTARVLEALRAERERAGVKDHLTTERVSAPYKFPKLVLHLGQRMMTVADELDFKLDLLGDHFYWDEDDHVWRENGPLGYINGRVVDCLNRMKYEPEQEAQA